MLLPETTEEIKTGEATHVFSPQNYSGLGPSPAMDNVLHALRNTEIDE